MPSANTALRLDAARGGVPAPRNWRFRTPAPRGKRENATMTPFVLTLVDADFSNLAAYYADQLRTSGTTDPAAGETGRRLYELGFRALRENVPCVSCHGPVAEGDADHGIPSLRWQHAQYLQERMATLPDSRGEGPVAEAHAHLARSTAGERGAIAQYLQGLGRTPEPEAPAGRDSERESGLMDNPEGKNVYEKACYACHATGAAGAPKLGDKVAWAPRIEKGLDALLDTAIEGKGAMPPRGACMDCSDAEMRAAIRYMVDESQ